MDPPLLPNNSASRDTRERTRVTVKLFYSERHLKKKKRKIEFLENVLDLLIVHLAKVTS